jgi:hypothetical protein
MSTIVKPLDIYVGDVKVFPDVDLSGVGNPIVQSDTFEEMMTWYNMESSEKACDARTLWWNEYGWTRGTTPIFMPVVEESDDSPWHTEGTLESKFWDFSEMGTLLEVPFDIDPKWLKNDRYGSQAFIMCDKLKTLSFDPNKPVAPFIMKDDQDNVVLKTEANLGSLFSRCYNLRSITGLVINDIQDFTYDTSYIQTGATLYYDDDNVRAGQSFVVDDANDAPHGLTVLIGNKGLYIAEFQCRVFLGIEDVAHITLHVRHILLAVFIKPIRKSHEIIHFAPVNNLYDLDTIHLGCKITHFL